MHLKAFEGFNLFLYIATACFGLINSKQRLKKSFLGFIVVLYIVILSFNPQNVFFFHAFNSFTIILFFYIIVSQKYKHKEGAKYESREPL